MKSQSDRRLPKFAPMPVSGPPVQTNPLVWVPKLHGFPYWLNLEAFAGKNFKPFYSTGALKEYAVSSPLYTVPPVFVEMDKQEILEVRARDNPWHPSGRLEKLVMRQWIEGYPNGDKTFLHTTLKFHGDGEQIECVSIFKVRESKSAPVTGIVRDAKYKGPRAANDTKSAVSGNTRKRP